MLFVKHALFIIFVYRVLIFNDLGEDSTAELLLPRTFYGRTPLAANRA